jgi:signal transduction histidine kinase
MAQAKPWVLCPICWHPIEIAGDKEFEKEHNCSNPTCPLSSLRVRARVFSDYEKAKKARKQSRDVFEIGEITRFSDINDNPINRWGYFYCDEPFGRFRLLDGSPLERLVARSFVADWEYGVATRIKKPLTIFLIEYDKRTGNYRKDGDAPYLTALRPQSEGGQAPMPVSYCEACKTAREKIAKSKFQDANFEDPCLISNKKLAKILFDEAQIDHEQLRLAVADPHRSAGWLFEKLHHFCWLGLMDMAFPIMVADVIVAVVFTGQVRIKGAELSNGQKEYRSHKLAELGLNENDIDALIAQDPEYSQDEAKNKFWNQLRESAYELQTITAGRYGQMGALSGALFNQKLRNLCKGREPQSYTKEKILADTGYDAIKEMSTFFSFKRAAILLKIGGIWKAAAVWAKGIDSKYSDNAPALEIELISSDSDVPNTDTTKEALRLLWRTYSFDENSSICWIKGDDDTWYFFADRKFEKGDIRRHFNRFSRQLLCDATLSFHQEMTAQFVAYQQIENISHIIHNLIGPSAILASSLASFDAKTQNKHLTEMNTITSNYRFLSDAIDELYESVEKCRYRIAFEIRKFQKGLNLNKELLKETRKIPIFDAELTLKGKPKPKGLWERTEWALGIYSGETQQRNIKIELHKNQRGLINKFVRMHPDNLQIAIENIVDNAVKYAYEDSVITVTISVEEMEGGKPWCALQISNYGNGVLESELDKIWGFGVRGQCSTTSKQEVSGTGLGLFIIKKIIAYYGGKVKLESHYGREVNYNKGEGFKTTVMISLPVYDS